MFNHERGEDAQSRNMNNKVRIRGTEDDGVSNNSEGNKEATYLLSHNNISATSNNDQGANQINEKMNHAVNLTEIAASQERHRSSTNTPS
ncbi:hypothetical protein RYX36_009320, partial [Vicia faba]